MYGRDLRLLTEEALGVQIDRWLVDIEDYKVEMFLDWLRQKLRKHKGIRRKSMIRKLDNQTCKWD